jgi:hypothetical protein
MGVTFSEKLRSVFGLIWGLCPLSEEKTHLLTGGYGGREAGKVGIGKGFHWIIAPLTLMS